MQRGINRSIRPSRGDRPLRICPGVIDHPSRLGVILWVQGKIVTQQAIKVNWANAFLGTCNPLQRLWFRPYSITSTSVSVRVRMFVLNFAIIAWVYSSRQRLMQIHERDLLVQRMHWTLPVYSRRMMSFYSSPLSLLTIVFGLQLGCAMCVLCNTFARICLSVCL